MSEKRLRFSIIGLLVAVAIASFGCGGGSRANSTRTGNDFITAVMPDTDSTSRSESGNVGLGEPPSNGGGENGADDPIASTQTTQVDQQLADNAKQEEGGKNGHTSTIVSTPGDGGNTPADSTQNTQTAQQSLPEGHELVDFQEEDAPLPWEHGLGAGQILMLPGESEEHGNMIVTCPSGNVACLIYVGTDGLVTYIGGGGTPSFKLIPPEGFPAIPLPQPNEAAQAPVLEFDFGSTLRVGADVAPRADELTTGVDRNGVRASYGEVQDGIGAERLLEFMQQHARLEDKLDHTGAGDAPGLETYPEPPTIHLAEGTSDLYARFAAHAVQLINNALPYEKRITLNSEPLPAETNLNDLPEGEIFLKFGSVSPSRALGSARLLSNYHTNSVTNQEEVQSANKAIVTINETRMRESYVHSPTPEDHYNWQLEFPDTRMKNSDTLIKYFNDQIFLSVVVHELVHALGFYHIDESRFSDSIMHSKIHDERGQVNEYSPYLPENTATILARGTLFFGETPGSIMYMLLNGREANEGEITVQPIIYPRTQGHLVTLKARTVPGHILFPIDRAALLAAYGRRLDPGAQPEELTAENLGSWSDTSFHLRGDMDFPDGEASFGVASMNGLAQAWATGTTPWTELADNEALSGSATWNGALMGVASSSETVAGDASLTVGLTSLTGQLDFTGLEKWGVNEAPGAAGSGATWGDGDLGYTIEVRGNTFIQTGGDDGKVTGAFFGAAHEAMGGVLERADLSAGFGGRR